MKLSIPERVALLSALPVQGSVITLRVLNELRTGLAFTEQEIEKYGIKNTASPQGGAIITWKPEMAEETKDVEIGKVARGVIIDRLRELDAKQILHVTMLPLYEKFVEDVN